MPLAVHGIDGIRARPDADLGHGSWGEVARSRVDTFGGTVALDRIAAVEDVRGGVEVTVDLAIETAGSEKPARVAQAVHRFHACPTRTPLRGGCRCRRPYPTRTRAPGTVLPRPAEEGEGP